MDIVLELLVLPYYQKEHRRRVRDLKEGRRREAPNNWKESWLSDRPQIKMRSVACSLHSLQTTNEECCHVSHSASWHYCAVSEKYVTLLQHSTVTQNFLSSLEWYSNLFPAYNGNEIIVPEISFNTNVQCKLTDILQMLT
jgi:hypothetical protein